MLARDGARVTLALVMFDLELFGGLLLEGFQRAGERADLVVAIEIAAVDGERDGKRQQHELRDQGALSGVALIESMRPGGVEGGVGHCDRARQAADRERAPLVGGQLGLLAFGQRVREAITQAQDKVLGRPPAGRITHLPEVVRGCAHGTGARDRR